MQYFRAAAGQGVQPGRLEAAKHFRHGQAEFSDQKKISGGEKA